MELGLLQPEPEWLLIDGRSQVEPCPGPPISSLSVLRLEEIKAVILLCRDSTGPLEMSHRGQHVLLFIDGTSLVTFTWWSWCPHPSGSILMPLIQLSVMR